MKVFSVLLAGGVSALFFAQSGSSLLQGHVKALQDAPGLTATLSVQPIGGSPKTFKIAYSKPNLLRIEHDDGWTLSDGTTLYTFSKKENSWSESPVSVESALSAAGLPEAWAWRAFFDKDALKSVLSSKVGATRVMKGAQVTEVSLNLEKDEATLFVDTKLGVARGFSYKNAEGILVVSSADIQLAKEPLPAARFAFAAPAGAKKAEAPKPSDAPTFAQVQAIMSRSCMPCHTNQRRSGGHEFTTYQGIANAVTPGDSASSELVRSISGPMPRMPQFRPPLPARDVETISKWIDAGAKRD